MPLTALPCLKVIAEYYGRFQITKPLLEMRNLARVAHLMVQCAAGRSRGLRAGSDFPHQSVQAQDSILVPPNFDPDTALMVPRTVTRLQRLNGSTQHAVETADL